MPGRVHIESRAAQAPTSTTHARREHMAFLDLQAMKRPGGHRGGGGSDLSLTACNGGSSLSVLCK